MRISIFRFDFTKRLSLALTLVLFAGTTLAAEPAPLHFGSAAIDIPAVMHKRLTPLTQYLSDNLNRPVILKLSPDMKDAIKKVTSGEVDFTYLPPIAYINAHSASNAKLIAKPLTEGKGTFQLMIAVRDDSSIKSVDDLHSKSFAFGDEAAILQRAVVVGAGAKLEQFSGFEYLGHYDNIVRAVLNRDFDAGIVNDITVAKWEGKGLRVIYRSDPLPPYNVTARGDLDQNTIDKIKSALLKLDHANPDHQLILNSFCDICTGFTSSTDEEYNVVRKLTAPFLTKK